MLLTMNELFGSEAKHSSFPWYSSSQSKISEARYSIFPWNSSYPSRNSNFPSCSSQSPDSVRHKFRYIFEHGPYDLGFKNKQMGINHDQVGTKSKNLDHNPMLTKLASYKSSILKFLNSMKPENCSTPNMLFNLNQYFIPSPSVAASGISTSLKRTPYFLLSLGALRHYHNGRLPLKLAQNMLYNRQLTRCIRHLNNHRMVYMVGLGVIVLASRWETIPYSKRRHFVLIPASKDKSFGDFLSKNDHQYENLPLDHPHSVRVRSISNKILQALQSDLKIKRMNNLELDEKMEVKLPWWQPSKFSTRHLEGLNWEVVVSHQYSANAHCLPGRIELHKGLLERLKSDEEIATVIGHEVGHIVARHSAETFTKLLFVITGILIIVCGAVRNALPFYLLGIDKLGELILNPISRRQEKEADYIGILLMASAGYDPRVAPKMYQDKDDSESES